MLCWHRLRRFASVRFAVVLLPLLGSLLPGQTKLSFQSRVAPNGDGEAVLVNQSNSPIVAWILEIFREPCNPIEAGRHIYTGYDSASDGTAIQPSVSHTQNIGASHCNKIGLSSPAKASLKLALFADGTSFGDSQWVAILLRDRQSRLQRLDRAIQALNEIKGTHTRPQSVALLEKARASLPEMEDPRVEFSTADPFETAIRQLTDNQTAPLAKQVSDLLAAFQAERGRLQKRG
jgi:hypothetical protein